MNKVTPAELWLTIAPEWIQNLPAWLEDILFKGYKCFIYGDRYMLFLKGLKNTLILTFFALLIGIALGIVVSLIRVSWDKNGSEMHGPAKWVLGFFNIIGKIYLTVIRGTPVVVQIMIMFFVVFASSRNKILVGCLCFGINSGAYVAEILRGGIMSIDQGQMEAGRSLGFGYVSTMRYIILPQAFKTVLPTMANEFIVLLKETSVACYVAVNDLTKGGEIIRSQTYIQAMPLLIVAALYLIMVVFFSHLVSKLERRLRSSDH